MTKNRLRAGTGRHRALRWGTALALGTAAVFATAAPAAAAPAEVDSGHLDWGFKASFRAYVSTGNGTPPIGAANGATINANGTFRFPVTGGSYDAASGAATVNYGGTVVFSYPAHFFTITVANPTVQLDGATRVLKADVDLAATGGGFEPVHVVQAVVATIGAGDAVVDGTSVSWTNLAVTMTETGASAFGGFYSAGSALDPLTSAVTLAAGEEPGGPGEPGGGSADQELTVDVPGGPLSLSSAGGTVALTGATIGGAATGALNATTVSDLRGTNAGWNLVGQVEDFTGDAGTIGAGQLGWSPTATAAPGSGTVTPGGAATGLGTGHTLCKSAPGASAGVFTCGAGLTLNIPATTKPGSYTATLTLTLS
ncbi:HtaA domain-containing protein [Dactylosporangium sp. AC04546]|uniref:HtaA domain-containing protein n=1 Tax=Dactylosporangium sp. AC04546 TaxID=2862460 RepID=UPI001EDFD9EF|nr:HtaA domain-containing protein [Dactylosporangium sp. AC04546]WVK79181.1 HtaA domain-containing protein [Dactylosporangium sp. AC04546]